MSHPTFSPLFVSFLIPLCYKLKRLTSIFRSVNLQIFFVISIFPFLRPESSQSKTSWPNLSAASNHGYLYLSFTVFYQFKIKPPWSFPWLAIIFFLLSLLNKCCNVFSYFQKSFLPTSFLYSSFAQLHSMFCIHYIFLKLLFQYHRMIAAGLCFRWDRGPSLLGEPEKSWKWIWFSSPTVIWKTFNVAVFYLEQHHAGCYFLNWRSFCIYVPHNLSLFGLDYSEIVYFQNVTSRTVSAANSRSQNFWEQ